MAVTSSYNEQDSSQHTIQKIIHSYIAKIKLGNGFDPSLKMANSFNRESELLPSWPFVLFAGL